MKEGCLSKAIPGFLLLHREGDKAAALRGHCAHLLAFAGSGVNCIRELLFMTSALEGGMSSSIEERLREVAWGSQNLLTSLMEAP